MISKIYLVLCLMLGSLAVADAADKAAPEALVQDVSQRVLKVINDDSVPKDGKLTELHGLIHEIVLPVIDFRAFAKLTLGKHWRKASAQQRDQFVDEFQSMLIRTYTKYLLDYHGTSVDVLPPRGRQKPRRKTVFTEVKLAGRAPLPVNYSFWLRGGEWKVYNVTVDGLSLVQLFRSNFAQEIEQTSLDSLIKRLASTNRGEASGSTQGAQPAPP